MAIDFIANLHPPGTNLPGEVNITFDTDKDEIVIQMSSYTDGSGNMVEARINSQLFISLLNSTSAAMRDYYIRKAEEAQKPSAGA